MRYQAVRWLHPAGTEHLDEPVELFAEIGDDNFEVRKVDVFRSRVAYASKDHEMGSTVLGWSEVPSVEDINVMPEFEARAITGEEFEAVWERATSA